MGGVGPWERTNSYEDIKQIQFDNTSTAATTTTNMTTTSKPLKSKRHNKCKQAGGGQATGSPTEHSVLDARKMLGYLIFTYLFSY